MTSVLRPGKRILNIPGYGVTVSRRAVSVAAAADWWAVAGKTCVGAYRSKSAASLAASYTNLAQPNDLTLGDAPSWSAGTGWTFNGTTNILRTGIIPTSGWSALVDFSGSMSYVAIFGSLGGGNSRFFVFANYDGYKAYGNGGQLNLGGGVNSGVIGFAGQQGYLNGAADGGAIDAWDQAYGFPISIGGYFDGQTNCWAGSIRSFVIYSDTLTAGEVATVSAAMVAL